MVSGLPFASHFLDLGDARLHYLDEGSGPPVICVHGNPTWCYFYRNVVSALKGTHRVIVPDHVGCGLSDKPPLGKYPYSLERRVADLTKLIDTLVPAGKLSLVVHDWGGMIGMAWATHNPERVDRIVAMNTAAFPLPANKRLPTSLKLGRSSLGPLLIRGFNAFCRGAAKWCVVRRPLPDDVRAMYLKPYDSWANRVAVNEFVQTIPLSPADAGYDIVAATESGLKQLTDRPVLLPWGLRDFVFDGDFLDGWKKRFPNAEVMALEDAGHYLLEDAGDEVIPRIAEFLST